MEGEKAVISVLVLNKNEELVKIIPHDEVYAFDQTIPRNQSDTLNASFKQTKENLGLLQNAAFLAISDNQGSFYEYKIQNVTTGDTAIEVVAVGALWDELNSYGYIKDKRPNEATATDLIDLVLDGTRIQRGYTAPNLVSNPKITSTSFYYETRLKALTEILEIFNLDIFFKIKLANNKISQRLIDVYDIYAIDKGRRFNYGTNALSVTYESDVSSIYTALVGRGSGIALTDETGAETGGYSRKITFADVEWSKANGDPVDKPKGQEYVELPEATQIYGFSDGKPRIGFIEFDDEEDPKELLTETYDSLVKVAYPQVQFKATVGDVGMMTPGEVVTIRRKDLDILYQTRVEKVVWNRVNEKLSQIEIGTTSYQSLSDTISNLTNQVNSAKDKSDSAERNSNWAIENGGSVISYGTNEPSNPAQNDLWYRFNDDGTITMLRYEDGQWVIVIDDATGKAIQEQVDDAMKEADDATKNAQDALDEVNRQNEEMAAGFDSIHNDLTTLSRSSANLWKLSELRKGEPKSDGIFDEEADKYSTDYLPVGLNTSIYAKEFEKVSVDGWINIYCYKYNEETQTFFTNGMVTNSYHFGPNNPNPLSINYPLIAGTTHIIISAPWITPPRDETGELMIVWGDQAPVSYNTGGDNGYFEVSKSVDGLSVKTENNTGDITALQVLADGLGSRVTNVENDYTELKQTADGLTVTVNGKADKSELIQLADQLTSTIEEKGQNNLISDSEMVDENDWYRSDNGFFTTDSSYSHGGSGSYVSKKSGLTSDAWTGIIEKTRFPVTSGDSLWASVWWKSITEPDQGFSMEIQFYAENNMGERIGYANFGVIKATDSDWHRLVQQATVPANARWADIHIYLNRNGMVSFSQPMVVANVDTLGPYNPHSTRRTEIAQTSKDIILSAVGNNGNQSLFQMNGDQILLKADSIMLNGSVSIEDASISSAKIASLSADKLTSGTIDANLINVVNINGANIVANSISGDKMTADAIQVGFQRMGSTIRISPTELSFWDGGNRSLSLQNDGMHIIDSNNAEDVGLIHTNHISGYPNYNGLTFDLNPKGDYIAWGTRRSDSDNFAVQMAWVRSAMSQDTGFSPGLNIVDQVSFGKGVYVPGSYQLLNFADIAVNDTHYPYFGSAGLKAGLLYGSTQTYLISDGTVYSLTKVIKALAGLSGGYSIPHVVNSDGTLRSWTNVTF